MPEKPPSRREPQLAPRPHSPAIFPPRPGRSANPKPAVSKGLSSLLQFSLRWLSLKDLLPLSQNTKIPLDGPQCLLLREELVPSLG